MCLELGLKFQLLNVGMLKQTLYTVTTFYHKLMSSYICATVFDQFLKKQKV